MIETFSGGKKMRIALARVLVINPDLIIMDEPTNYLDMETILWLEEWLQNFPGSILMTTHDRYFMNNVCKKIIEIAHRRVTVYSGNFDFYERESKVRLEQIKAEAKRQAESIAKDEEFIEKFKEASHASQVQSRVKKLEKIERIEIPPEEETIDFEFAKPPRGGDDVVVVKDLKKGSPQESGEDKLIFENLTSTIKRMEKSGRSWGKRSREIDSSKNDWLTKLIQLKGVFRSPRVLKLVTSASFRLMFLIRRTLCLKKFSLLYLRQVMVF